MPTIFTEYLVTLGWGITGAITMAFALPILLKVFDWFTPINEWEELKKGNVGVAIVLASLIIAFAIVMSVSILPPAA